MKFSITISRNSKDRVGIDIKCRTSRMRFLQLDLSLEEYAWVMTGLSEVEVEGIVKGLDVVGKERIVEKRSIDLNIRSDKDVIEKYLIDNCQEEGWTLNTYLGSQKSIEYRGDGSYTVNYSVYKYVEVGE